MTGHECTTLLNTALSFFLCKRVCAAQTPYWGFGLGITGIIRRLTLWQEVLDVILAKGLENPRDTGVKVAIDSFHEALEREYLEKMKKYVGATMPFTHNWGGDTPAEKAARASACYNKIHAFEKLEDFEWLNQDDDEDEEKEGDNDGEAVAAGEARFRGTLHTRTDAAAIAVDQRTWGEIWDL